MNFWWNPHNEDWEHFGLNITLEGMTFWVQVHLSMSADRQTIAIGREEDTYNDENFWSAGSGSVQVMRYVCGLWGPMGDIIYGENPDDRAGLPVLSPDGLTLAIASKNKAYFGKGQVLVLSRNGNNWSFLTLIEGKHSDSGFGDSADGISFPMMAALLHSEKKQQQRR